MANTSFVSIRRARRDDVRTIVEMLADDPLGSGREKLDEPLPPSYFHAFEKVDRDEGLSSWSPRTLTAKSSAACSSASCRA
jgi:hypothetical protein